MGICIYYGLTLIILLLYMLTNLAAKKLGFLYEIWIYDNKGNKVEFYN